MCFIPVDSDAPIYHYPLTTVGLIATNIVTFVATDWGFGRMADEWILSFGHGYDFQQWLTYSFVHFGPLHLVGNMVGLWAFGMIIEGKIGFWKFLLLYLAIGVTGGAVLQWWMQNAVGPPIGCGGASLVIFALMGICLIWSPLNDLQCVMIWWNRTVEFDMPVVWFSGLCIAKEMFLTGAGEFQMGSAFGHSLGAVIGLVAGVGLLKHKLVDCEGWDVFTVSKGAHNKGYFERYRRPAPEGDAETVSVEDQQRANKKELRSALHDHDWLSAWQSYVRCVPRTRQSIVSLKQLGMIANGLYRQHLYNEAADAFFAVLERSTEPDPEVRLKLAAILTEVQHRPKAALRVLHPLEHHRLPARLSEKRKQIGRLATRMIDEGCLEIASR